MVFELARMSSRMEQVFSRLAAPDAIGPSSVTTYAHFAAESLRCVWRIQAITDPVEHSAR